MLCPLRALAAAKLSGQYTSSSKVWASSSGNFVDIHAMQGRFMGSTGFLCAVRSGRTAWGGISRPEVSDQFFSFPAMRAMAASAPDFFSTNTSTAAMMEPVRATTINGTK